MFDFTLKGTFNADISIVYNAFNDPQIISLWLAPGNLVVTDFMSNFSRGGHYRAMLKSPDGFAQTIVGTYQDIEFNKHLSFTWRWDDSDDITKVEVSFEETENSSTHIVLKQSGFFKQQDMMAQQYTWLACLEKLSVNTRAVGAH